MKYRTLSRNTAHRQALLRNLVTSLVKHESIRTTWPKAKEAQRLAEKLVTLGKRDTVAARQRVQGILFDQSLVAKVFGPIRERYLERPGGYTRVLRIEPLREDQAPSAILELVDHALDTRLAMTARTVARQRALGRELNDVTKGNIVKVTRFRKDGEEHFEELVRKMTELKAGTDEEKVETPFRYKKWTVYPPRQ